MFKYALNTNTLGRDVTPEAAVKLAKEVGLDGIEWGLPKLDKARDAIREMVQMTREAGLDVAGFLNGGKIWKKDEIEAWAEVVASIGGGSLRAAHPWIAWDYNESVHQRDSFHDIFKLAHDALPHLAELSQSHGVQFLVEMHCGALTASAPVAAQLLKTCDPARVAVIYDPGNTAIEGRLRPRNEVEILGRHLAVVHAKNMACVFNGEFMEHPVPRAKWSFKACPPEYGVVDFVEVIYALKTVRYEGWVNFEEFFKGGNPEIPLKASLAFLKECERAVPSAPQEPYTSFNA